MVNEEDDDTFEVGRLRATGCVIAASPQRPRSGVPKCTTLRLLEEMEIVVRHDPRGVTLQPDFSSPGEEALPSFDAAPLVGVQCVVAQLREREHACSLGKTVARGASSLMQTAWRGSVDERRANKIGPSNERAFTCCNGECPRASCPPHWPYSPTSLDSRRTQAVNLPHGVITPPASDDLNQLRLWQRYHWQGRTAQIAR